MVFAIGQEELDKNDPVGKYVDCLHCGGTHKIEYADEILEDGTLKPCKLLAFYKCGDTAYLEGIAGMKV